jgi:MFS family permease
MRHPILRPLTLASMTFGALHNLAFASFVLFMTRELDMDAGEIGASYGFGALGWLAGVIVARSSGPRLLERRTIALALTVAVAFCVPCAFATAATAVAVISICGFAVSASLAVFEVAALTVRQNVTPNEELGRVSGAVRFFTWGIRPLALIAGGALADAVGLRAAFLWPAVLCFASVAWLAAADTGGLAQSRGTRLDLARAR